MTKQLLNIYNLRKKRIKQRLDDFKRFYNQPVSWFYQDNKIALKTVDKTDNERIFEELVFCLLTANTSAVIGMKAVDSVRDILIDGNLKEIQDKLKKAGYRFPNKRAEYIVEAREKFKQDYNFDFKKIIESYSDTKELREFFVNNVKGLGYKEESHFLRNIGIFGLAILDKHILRSLKEFGVIDEVPKNLNRNRYLEIEQKFIEFSNNLNINMDELDLLLWSMKNGQIMK
jgi:N-glycosylase/DNA lyase